MPWDEFAILMLAAFGTGLLVSGIALLMGL